MIPISVEVKLHQCKGNSATRIAYHKCYEVNEKPSYCKQNALSIIKKCYIWYSEEGLGGLRSRPILSLLLAVPNVTAHLSTASVTTSYYLMWHYNYTSAL